MTDFANDQTRVAQLRDIAQVLEDYVGGAAAPGLRGDSQQLSQLRRIREAIQPVLVALTNPEKALTLAFNVQGPDSAKTHAGRGTKSFGVWLNDTGSTLTIKRVRATADTLNYAFTLFKSASVTDFGTVNDAQLALVTCATAITAAFTADLSSFDSATVEDGKYIIWEHTSGTANSLSVQIEGAFA
jgi:hypothetical protein